MVIATAQYVSAIISWVLLRVFTRFEIIGLENLREINRPFLVVANHESYLDPQLIGVTFLHRPTLFPLRYMAFNYLLYVPVFGQLIWLLGAFPAHKGKGIGRSLLAPVKILEKGQGVVMFPEGDIFKKRPELGRGHRGAAILALTARAQIVPLSLHTPSQLHPLKFIFRRPKIVVRVGEPYYLNNLDYPDFSDQYTYAATDVIMKKIGDLYFQHEY